MSLARSTDLFALCFAPPLTACIDEFRPTTGSGCIGCGVNSPRTTWVQ